MEHGAILHGQGVTQIETAIAEGRLDEDDWQYVYTIMAKNMGHFCMILHSMVRYSYIYKSTPFYQAKIHIFIICESVSLIPKCLNVR